MIDSKPCRCCGVPQVGRRADLRRCVLCDGCDRVHGAERQAKIERLVANGQMTPWFAIGQIMIDDAHHAGQLGFRGDPTAATIWIDRPVCRWEVVIGRAIARNELPVTDELMAAVMLRYVPGPIAGIPGLRRELKDALCALDPDVLDVEVSCTRDAMDAGHLIIDVIHRTAVLSAVDRWQSAPDVEIPSDIAQRPRGQA